MAIEEIIAVAAGALLLWWMLQQVPRRELPINHEATHSKPQAEIRAKRSRKSVNIPIAQLRRRKAKEIRGNVPGG